MDGASKARLAPQLVSVLLLVAALAAAQDLTPAQQYFQKGYAYHTGDGVELDYEVALRYYREALKRDPELYEGHANAGRAYYATEDYRRARYHLRLAITMAREREEVGAGEEAGISNDLGSCFYQEGNTKEAEKWFRFAIGQQPALSEAHYNLINLLIAGERIAEAREAIAVAARQAPSPRYGLFEGRLRSQESHAEWNPDWLVPAILVFAASLVLYSLYRRTRQS